MILIDVFYARVFSSISNGEPFVALGWPPKAWPGAQGLVSEESVAPGNMDAVGLSPAGVRLGCQK